MIYVDIYIFFLSTLLSCYHFDFHPTFYLILFTLFFKWLLKAVTWQISDERALVISIKLLHIVNLLFSHMSLSICRFSYICIYFYNFIYFKCVYIYIYICFDICICWYIYIYIWIHNHVYICMYIFLLIHVYTCCYIYIFCFIHHHHVAPLAWISLTLSCHSSRLFLASGRSSRLHLCLYRAVVNKF